LGLAISKHFVEAHDGRIWAESEEGQGSTFHFALPVPGHHVPVSYLHRERPPEIIHDRARPSLLVVDPDPDVASLIRRHLEAYDVIHVGDAAAVNDAIALHHPQAVVRNIAPGKSPDWSADTAASVPVVDCSLPSRAWAADDLSLVACLTKPITTDHLANEIARVGHVQDVLVVDDDRDFCQLVERMLGSMGSKVTLRRAYGGEDGLGALRARRPDLVLLDLAMPGMDGLQMLEIMRSEPGLSDVPVVLLTATSYAEDTLAQRGSRVLVDRPGGLSPIEVLHTLRAVIGVLRPHYDEHAILSGQIAA
jgi:CheY-like chemotaxis protein